MLLYCFSRSSVKFQSHAAQQIVDFDPNWAFPALTPIHQWLRMMHKAWRSVEEEPYCFSKVITRDNKSLILTRIERFRTVALVWIHRWLWNDAQSLTQHRRGALLFFNVIHQISRSHGTQNRWFFSRIERFRAVTPVWNHRWLWNDAQSLMWHWRDDLLFFKVIRQISRLHGTKKNRRFWPELSVSGQ